MNRIIRNIGIVIIFIAIIILAIELIYDLNSNIFLGISGLLLVIGLSTYIFLQKLY